MSITTTRFAVTIIEIVWILSLGRSVIIMIGGKEVFKKAYKNENSAFIPILNLFYMLEIADVSTFFGILFFVPFFNLLPLMLMGAGLGKNFKCSGGFTAGLVLLPVVFYPMLAFSDKSYKVSDEKYFKALDSVRGENVNLMTPDDIAQQNNTVVEEENPVDSIFKSDLQMMEQAPAYRASKIDQNVLEGMDSLTTDYDEFAPIKKVEPGFQTYGEANKDDSTPIQSEKKDKNVEFIDL
jgi:hypothetical protein